MSARNHAQSEDRAWLFSVKTNPMLSTWNNAARRVKSELNCHRLLRLWIDPNTDDKPDFDETDAKAKKQGHRCASP
jgi:DNA-directed RNA polymerase specialized sigma24 family protein